MPCVLWYRAQGPDGDSVCVRNQVSVCFDHGRSCAKTHGVRERVLLHGSFYTSIFLFYMTELESKGCIYPKENAWLRWDPGGFCAGQQPVTLELLPSRKMDHVFCAQYNVMCCCLFVIWQRLKSFQLFAGGPPKYSLAMCDVTHISEWRASPA